jgi:hypothetical protein
MSDEFKTLISLKYARKEESKQNKKAEGKQKENVGTVGVGYYDEHRRVIQMKYLKKPITNIVPVDIDFPLPKQIEGADKRMNTPLHFEVPKELGIRRKPTCLIGEILRVDEVLRNHEKYIDKEILVAGWANSTRMAEKDTIIFIELIDGTSSTPLQVVASSDLPNWEDLKKAKKSYSFRIKGTLIKSLGKGQAAELSVKNPTIHYVKILGKCDDKKYPLGGYNFTNEYLREIAHLRIRTRTNATVARVKNALAYSTHLFFQNNGFIYVKTPIITTSDCEGAG